jgi:hypothetical protein
MVKRSTLKCGASHDSIAFAAARNQFALKLVETLIHEKGHDFAAAACNLKPEAWRLFFYRGTYGLDALSVATFNANASLRKQCHEADEFEDPPSSWLGDFAPIDRVAAEAEICLREIGEDGCNAVWVILAMAQLLDLSRSEILRCQWWDPQWVLPLTRWVRFVP